MRQFQRGSVWLAAASGLALLAAGCQGRQDKLVYENFQLVRVRVSDRSHVTRSIGDPDHELGDEWLYLRPENHLVVRVEFDESGRVARTHGSDGGSETWEDSADAGGNQAGSGDGSP